MNSSLFCFAALAMVPIALLMIRLEWAEKAHRVGSLKQALGEKLIGERVFCGLFFTDPAQVQEITPQGVKVWGATLFGPYVSELKDKTLVHVTAYLDERLERPPTTETGT